jgi:hypothetical protein
MKPKQAVMTVALVVGGIRLWMQIRGKTTTPFSEWAIGYGVLVIFLAFLAEAYPAAAGPLAGTVIVGDLLKNGAGLFDDITAAIGQAGKGQSIFVSEPFASSSSGSSGGDVLTPSQLITLGGGPTPNPRFGVAAPGQSGTPPAGTNTLPNPVTGWNSGGL